MTAAKETDDRPRRTYGSGSVYQRKTDGRYIASVYAGFSGTGARRRITVSAKTRAAVLVKLRDVQRSADPDQYVGNRARTVKSWCDEWLTIMEKEKRPKTMTDYRSVCHKWIIPTVGHKRISRLTPSDVRALADAHATAGNSTTTAAHTHAVFLAILRAATVEGLPVPSRLLVAKSPPKGRHNRRAMTTPEAVAVLREAARLPDGSRWVAALFCGLRQGEALGLTWADVDFEAETITVRAQLSALPYLNRKDGTFRVPQNHESIHLYKAWHLVRTKTKSGERVIPLVPWVVESLRAWRDVCPWSPYDLVWPRLDGRPVYQAQDRDEWWALQGSAGVGHPDGRYYHLHEARNTTATLLLEAKVDPKIVTAILGHTTIDMSRLYQDVSIPVARSAMESVATRLELGA